LGSSFLTRCGSSYRALHFDSDPEEKPLTFLPFTENIARMSAGFSEYRDDFLKAVKDTSRLLMDRTPKDATFLLLDASEQCTGISPGVELRSWEPFQLHPEAGARHHTASSPSIAKVPETTMRQGVTQAPEMVTSLDAMAKSVDVHRLDARRFKHRWGQPFLRQEAKA
jgi:hypothetical protein